MRVVLQRVKHAQVSIKQESVGKINTGYLLLVGFEDKDGTEQIDYLVQNGHMPEEETKPDTNRIEEVSLKDLSFQELKELAKEKGINGYTKMNKEELLDSLKEND